MAESEEGREEISFTLEEVQYTPEQIKILFEKAIMDLERQVNASPLARNSSGFRKYYAVIKFLIRRS